MQLYRGMTHIWISITSILDIHEIDVRYDGYGYPHLSWRWHDDATFSFDAPGQRENDRANIGTCTLSTRTTGAKQLNSLKAWRFSVKGAHAAGGTSGCDRAYVVTS